MPLGLRLDLINAALQQERMLELAEAAAKQWTGTFNPAGCGSRFAVGHLSKRVLSKAGESMPSNRSMAIGKIVAIAVAVVVVTQLISSSHATLADSGLQDQQKQAVAQLVPPLGFESPSADRVHRARRGTNRENSGLLRAMENRI